MSALTLAYSWSRSVLLTGRSSGLYHHAHGLVHRVRPGSSTLTTTSALIIAYRSIIGPMIGGALARPCISYPTLFPRGTIWDRYPYLLPNLFSAAAVFVGVIAGVLFLDETHSMKRLERDRGRELGDRLVALFRKSAVCKCRGRTPEKQCLLASDGLAGYETLGGCPRTTGKMSNGDEPLPAYQSRENSPRLAPQVDPEPRAAITQPQQPDSQASHKPKVFIKPVIMNIISYGILALCVFQYTPLTWPTY